MLNQLLEPGLFSWAPVFSVSNPKPLPPTHNLTSYAFVPTLDTSVGGCETFPDIVSRAAVAVALVTAVMGPPLGQLWEPIPLTQIGTSLPTPPQTASLVGGEVLVTLEDKGWGYPLSSFPDFHQRSQDYQYLSYIPAINRWGLDVGEMPWSWWSDFPGRQAPRTIDFQAFASNINPIVSSFDPSHQPWGPFYPDWIGKSPPIPLGELTSFLSEGIEALDFFKGWYPDRIDIKSPTYQLGQIAYTPAINRWGLDNTAKGWYPDSVRGLTPLPSEAISWVATLLEEDREIELWYPAGGNPPNKLIGVDISSQSVLAYVPAINRWGLDIGEGPLAFYPTILPGRSLPPIPYGELSEFWVSTPPYRGEFPAAWWPDFPGRTIPRSIDFPALAYVPAINRWGLDLGEKPWSCYPDLLPGRTLPPIPIGEITSFYVTPPVYRGETPNAIFPDFPGRNVPRAVEYPNFFYIPAINRWGTDVGGLAWLGIPGPDPVSTPNRLPNLFSAQTFFELEEPSEIQWWIPNYPERVLGKSYCIEKPYLSYVPAINRWGLDVGEKPWVSFPDLIPGRNLPPMPLGETVSFYSSSPLYNGEYPLSIYPDFPGRNNPRSVEYPFNAYTPAINRWGIDVGGLSWLGNPGIDPVFVKGLPPNQFTAQTLWIQEEPASELTWWQPYSPERFPARTCPEKTCIAYVPAISQWGIDAGLVWCIIPVDQIGQRRTGIMVTQSMSLEQPQSISWLVEQSIPGILPKVQEGGFVAPYLVTTPPPPVPDITIPVFPQPISSSLPIATSGYSVIVEFGELMQYRPGPRWFFLIGKRFPLP